MADSWNGDPRQQQILDALDSVAHGNPVDHALAEDDLVQIADAIRESRPRPSKKYRRRMGKAIDRGVADNRGRRRWIELGLSERFSALDTQRLALA